MEWKCDLTVGEGNERSHPLYGTNQTFSGIQHEPLMAIQKTLLMQDQLENQPINQYIIMIIIIIINYHYYYYYYLPLLLL